LLVAAKCLVNFFRRLCSLVFADFFDRAGLWFTYCYKSLLILRVVEVLSSLFFSEGCSRWAFQEDIVEVQLRLELV
jgi:hypothetical protein